jgi:GntR family transcriptional repressor for pyruvate dehydrogenase complex
MSTPTESPSGWQPGRLALERGNISEQILNDLRERILEGSLVRGARLPAERELAVAYGVSGATVREALRALATTHMIEVRHGSGAYVTADADQLIAQSLQSMIQLEKVEIGDSFGVLTVLNVYGAELAAARATPQDIAQLWAALHAIEGADDPERLTAALKQFMHALADASHNHLLMAICKCLAGVHVGMTRKISAGSPAVWQRIRETLKQDRRHLIEAIAAGDTAQARACALVFHRHAVQAVVGEADGASA